MIFAILSKKFKISYKNTQIHLTVNSISCIFEKNRKSLYLELDIGFYFSIL